MTVPIWIAIVTFGLGMILSPALILLAVVLDEMRANRDRAARDPNQTRLEI